MDVKGFIDDDLEKRGAVIHGIRVLGTTEDLPRLVRELGIQQVVITIAQISRQEILRLIGVCRKIQVSVRIIPGLYDVLQGKVHVTRIRNVQIEDLLGREPIYLDEAQIGAFLAGKRVMVTGAGGSIGSELARQVARFQPKKLLLVERAEFALFEVDGELRRTRPEVDIGPLVADVCDEARMRMLLQEHAPQVIFHAAAHKHVPLMEANPSEAIKNNVLGTRLLGELAIEHNVEAFVHDLDGQGRAPDVHHGSDQARGGARDPGPRADEQHALRRRPVRQRHRLGRLGGSRSSGSRSARGGPVTVTHPEMRRYFMTIPEASQLVLQAGAMGEGGEIFILDMGEPVRVLDLAEEMITLTGLRPYVDMDIVFTGLRPGREALRGARADRRADLEDEAPQDLRRQAPGLSARHGRARAALPAGSVARGRRDGRAQVPQLAAPRGQPRRAPLDARVGPQDRGFGSGDAASAARRVSTLARSSRGSAHGSPAPSRTALDGTMTTLG